MPFMSRRWLKRHRVEVGGQHVGVPGEAAGVCQSALRWAGEAWRSSVARQGGQGRRPRQRRQRGRRVEAPSEAAQAALTGPRRRSAVYVGQAREAGHQVGRPSTLERYQRQAARAALEWAAPDVRPRARWAAGGQDRRRQSSCRRACCSVCDLCQCRRWWAVAVDEELRQQRLEAAGRAWLSC
jgi:hypothetical protein